MSRRQQVWCRYREAPSLRRGLRPHHVQRDRVGTWEIQPRPPEWSPAGAASKGKPELVASRLEVGPAHTTAEAMEGNDMVEGRGRPEHAGSGEGPDTALATITAEPSACERGGLGYRPDAVHGFVRRG